MSTIVNNPGDNQGSGAGIIIGVIVAIIVIALFVLYALPALRNTNDSKDMQIDVNIPIPTQNEGGEPATQ